MCVASVNPNRNPFAQMLEGVMRPLASVASWLLTTAQSHHLACVNAHTHTLDISAVETKEPDL